MEIKQGVNNFFVADENNKPRAWVNYLPKAGVLVANHVFVSPELRGQGLAQRLVAHLVDYARQNDLKIKPTCPYAVKSFAEHPEYADVAAE